MKKSLLSFCWIIMMIVMLAPASAAAKEEIPPPKNPSVPQSAQYNGDPAPVVKRIQSPAPDKKAGPSSIRVAGIEFSDGADLGPWWRKSATLNVPAPESILYHVRCDYAYARWGGNINMEGQKATLELTLRKDLYTGLTLFNLNKSRTTNVLRSRSAEIEDRMFAQRVYYDISDRLAILAAVRLEKSLSRFIDDRWACLGGVRWIVADTPVYNIRVSGLWGYARTEYANQEIWNIPKYTDFIGVGDCRSTAWAFLQQLNYRFSESISIQQAFEYLQFTAYSGYRNWKADVGLNVKLTNRLTYFSQVTTVYDNNSLVQTLKRYLDWKRTVIGSQAGNIETMDISFATGIRFEF